MDMTKWIVLGVVLVAAIVGAVLYFRSKKKDMDQLFEHIFESLKQVPKQKKQSFLLFMLKETIKASKTKDANLQGKLNNPKLLEVQLVQMASILKDRTKVTDKRMKQALQLYDSYLHWEKKKLPK